MLPVLRVSVLCALVLLVSSHQTVPRWRPGDPERHAFPVACANPRPRCAPHPDRCSRVVRDNFISPEETAALKKIVDKGMAFAPDAAALGGPTIMDINSGFVRSSEGPVANMHKQALQAGQPPVFSSDEFELYRRVVHRIRDQIQQEFGLKLLHFTAPTFVTREVGNQSWQPKSMHDVYWHPHVDKNNTAHYDYSGLLYLSDHGVDFQGGMFSFMDGLQGFAQPVPCFDEDILAQGAQHSCAQYAKAGMCNKSLGEQVTLSQMCPKSCKMCTPEQNVELEAPSELLVEPGTARLVLFGSGTENLHRVKRVSSGTRYVLSLWFTCDESKLFHDFLDAKARSTFAASEDASSPPAGASMQLKSLAALAVGLGAVLLVRRAFAATCSSQQRERLLRPSSPLVKRKPATKKKRS